VAVDQTHREDPLAKVIKITYNKRVSRPETPWKKAQLPSRYISKNQSGVNKS